MKRINVIFVCFMLVMFAIIIIYCNEPRRTEARVYTNEERMFIKKKVKVNRIFAEVLENTYAYKSQSEYGGVAKRLLKGSKVEIFEDRGLKWYKVKDGWVMGKFLKISEDEKTNEEFLKDEWAEGYINIIEAESKTDYFVWVDTDRQRVYIFKGSKGNWKIQKRIVCSTGKNVSPTIKGFFELGDRGKWFYSERLKSGAVYWVRFRDSYLFHSIAMDREKNVIDGVLGEKRSSGCIRMSIEDSFWFFENMPENTGVYIS